MPTKILMPGLYCEAGLPRLTVGAERSMRVTHLTLDETTRQLAAMRASIRLRNMAEHVADLIRADADAAGLTDFLAETDAESEVAPAASNGTT